jgi:hypothetical protein
MPGDGKDAIGLDREMKLVSSGYADVNGIKLYHEIYGSRADFFLDAVMPRRPAPSIVERSRPSR